MSLDGFIGRHKEAFEGFSGDLEKRTGAAIDWLGRKLGVEVIGIDRLPTKGALLVANHAFGVWELAFVVARVRVETGRTIWSLGEHLWWRIPFLRRYATAIGVVDGTQENADALLRADQLVLVLPGGLREALKPMELRYRLLWGRRYGFVRAALRNGVPIVPIACIGGDDLVDLRGNAYTRGRRWHLPIPMPWPAHLPHRAHLRAVIGEPIQVDTRASNLDEDSVVKSLRREVEGALHELIEEELARREGFPYE